MYNGGNVVHVYLPLPCFLVTWLVRVTLISCIARGFFSRPITDEEVPKPHNAPSTTANCQPPTFDGVRKTLRSYYCKAQNIQHAAKNCSTRYAARFGDIELLPALRIYIYSVYHAPNYKFRNGLTLENNPQNNIVPSLLEKLTATRGKLFILRREITVIFFSQCFRVFFVGQMVNFWNRKIHRHLV